MTETIVLRAQNSILRAIDSGEKEEEEEEEEEKYKKMKEERSSFSILQRTVID